MTRAGVFEGESVAEVKKARFLGKNDLLLLDGVGGAEYIARSFKALVVGPFAVQTQGWKVSLFQKDTFLREGYFLGHRGLPMLSLKGGFCAVSW